MKNLTLSILAMLITLSRACGQPNNYDQAAYGNNRSTTDAPAYVNLTAQAPSGTPAASGVVMQEIRDPNTGMVNMYMPLPTDWQIGPTGIQGPGGATITEVPGASFMGNQRFIQSVDQIIQQDILPKIQQNGAQFLRTIDLPEVARRDELLGKQYWTAMPMEKRYQTKGIEGIDKEGKPALLVVHYVQSRTQYGVHHSYYLHGLSSSKVRYETDKQVLLYALANQQSNPEAVVAFNKKMQQEYLRRERLHGAKMQQAWNHFNTWNRNHVETWNDISDSSMASWRRQNDMRDAGQARAVDGILERERLVSPFDGKELDVDAGYKYYYTNTFGEVIGSNDEFFDPQRNPNLNNQEWRRATIGGQ